MSEPVGEAVDKRPRAFDDLAVARAAGRRGGKRSGQVRRKLTLEDVEAALGPLDGPEDAKRQLHQLVLWGAGGLLAGTVLNGSVRGLEVWLKAHAEQLDAERVAVLERRIKDLEAELKQAGRQAP